MELEPFVFSHRGAITGSAAVPPEETGGLMAAVNRYALRPLNFNEVAVFTLDLCNNQVDKHFSRFPEEELQRINRLTPGRPLMERHDVSGTLPRGTFFRSSLHRENDRVSVRPDVYVLRTAGNGDFILNIEGGVYRETSIGFSFRLPECSICAKDLRRCSHIPGRSYGGKTCHFIMREVLDVLEGSVVPMGSQGTHFVGRETQPRTVAPAPVDALTAARAAFHQPAELWSLPWASE